MPSRRPPSRHCAPRRPSGKSAFLWAVQALRTFSHMPACMRAEAFCPPDSCDCLLPLLQSSRPVRCVPGPRGQSADPPAEAVEGPRVLGVQGTSRECRFRVWRLRTRRPCATALRGAMGIHPDRGRFILVLGFGHWQVQRSLAGAARCRDPDWRLY